MALTAVLPVILLAISAWLVLFELNRFELSLNMLGGETMTLEYGQSYQEPGCRMP